ncbi:MAG: threonylcarbamoyl-AMP synthase [Gammaproteobacteria bacterium]|nr:threonylcarbamoyl-AMP synthase [Gammaproteobacteria bacterium]
MSQYLELNPAHPDPRVLSLIKVSLEAGAVIAYPTDSGFALGCAMGKAEPLNRIKKIRNLADDHHFTLMCRDLSELSRFARVDNSVFRILKRCTPGGYTFILKATAEVPKIMLHDQKRTIGIRIPDHAIPLAILETLEKPILSTTLILPGRTEPVIYPEDVSDALFNEVDVVIDGGYCGFEPTTVVDLTEETPIVLREGSGNADIFR